VTNNPDLNRLVPADEARAIVLNNVQPAGQEHVDLASAGNRILSENVSSLRTQPPFDASAMDGYAVQQADIQDLPAHHLQMVGTSRAGEPFDGSLKPGQVVRIFTGAVVPEGADSIVIQENTQRNDTSITILQGVTEGRFIRKAGLDFKTGETLLRRQDILTPNRIALAASMNHDQLPVFNKPRVALIATGDELVMPGGELSHGQIIASNTLGLKVGIENCGGDVLDMGIVADKSRALETAFKTAIDNKCDLIITTGGASVGDHDLVMPSAKACGFDFEIAKIAMRPGKPFLFAKKHTNDHVTYLTGLAGNPVSSLIAFNVFVKPLIQLLSGRNADDIGIQNATLGCNLPENDNRAEFMRATLERDNTGNWLASPFELQDSSMLANLVRANCLVWRPVNAPAASKGDPCEIVLLD
jgi:molybdopterin molybdotransferase